jgi:tetratricopeptide (TPR) repeat protein
LTGIRTLRATVAASAAAVAAFISASALAETAPRWRPHDGDEVVLVLPESAARSTGEVRATTDPMLAAGQAEAFSALARRTRDARWFGRAEALVEPWIARTDAPARLLVAAADLAQQRHEFIAARSLLDRALAAEPANPGARLQRANVVLLLGDFGAARADCRAVLAAGHTLAGTVCLASAATGAGSVARARQLLASLDRQGEMPAPLAQWQLLAAADLASRDGDPDAAIALLARAHALDPAHEETRARLAGLLIERGEPQAALRLTTGENVSAALLVARLRAASGTDPVVARAARRELHALLEVGRLRGTNAHLREAGELALRADRDPGRALALARANFAVQKDTPDLRLLAEAAVAAGDRATIRYLRDWLKATGFEDRVASARLAEAGA